MEEKVFMRGYKAFDKGMICNAKQYAENTVFEEEEAIICKKGMHFCTNPMDCMNYYSITIDTEYAEVEALAECVCEIYAKDSKYCTTKLRIGKRLSLEEFINACVEYNKSNDDGDNSNLVSSGNSSQLASSGDFSKLVSIGDNSNLASSGEYSSLVSSGNGSQLASAGYASNLASSGEYSKLSSSGDYSRMVSGGDDSKLSSSGDYSRMVSGGDDSYLSSSGDYSRMVSTGDDSYLSSSGEYSRLSSSGYYSNLSSTGNGSVISNIGVCGRAKGVKGTWITLAEYNDKGECICVKAAKITGRKLKENTWYTLKNGEFVEAKNIDEI